MAELAKISSVAKKLIPDAPHEVLLVLDATTGQNAISQVAEFGKAAGVSGLIVTKLDGTAKGGVVVALSAKFDIPIYAIGVGEKITDFENFDAAAFAKRLVS
jgi:fused signal recognition particle receptor